MQVFQSPFDRPRTPSIVAIGSFDGLHLGHQRLIAQLRAQSLERHVPSVVYTFDQPTRVLLEGSKFLYTLPEKLEILRDFAVDETIAVPFTREFSQRDKTAFLEDIAALQPQGIVVGDDFRFGHGRAGGIADLETLTVVTALPMVTMDGVAVKASAIRAALEAGDVRGARAMLGRAYSANGVVVRGQQLGRTIGFPTANIAVPEGKLLPKGVYAVRLETRGERFDGMANIGTRPTVGGMTESFEVNVFDFDADIYGLEVRVLFEGFIRAEQKFAGLPALVAQLGRDRETALALLSTLS
jgi:riboflavin kinase / FMN adenylyltransferase